MNFEKSQKILFVIQWQNKESENGAVFSKKKSEDTIRCIFLFGVGP